MPDDDVLMTMGDLRSLRSEAVYLKGKIVPIVTATRLKDPEARTKETKAAIADARTAYDQCKTDLEDQFDLIVQRCRDDAVSNDYWGDTVTMVRDLFRDVGRDWPREADADNAIAVCDALDQVLDEIIFKLEVSTISNRLKQHLDATRIGRPINFAANFEDELPTPELRARVLEYIADHPTAVSATVDLEHGLVYRTTNKGWRVWRPLVGLALLTAIGAAIAWLLPNVVDSLDDKTTNAKMLQVYGAVLVGGLAHIAVDALKGYRSSGGDTFLVVEDGLVWLQIREAQFYIGLMTLWIGVAGLALSASGPLNVTAGFFVGYSIDSFADLFLQRFSVFAEKKEKRITKRINSETATPAAK